MQVAKLEFRIPEAEVPEGADPAGLEKRVTEELKAFSEKLPPGKVKIDPSRKEPVPEGAAGISALVSWGITFYFQHHNEIMEALPVIRALLSGISTATRYFMGKGKKAKGEEAVVRLRIGDREISLPSDNESIEKFLEQLTKQLSEGKK